MGHVDHGKTSLLDYIRHSSVTAREAGGITQHIGAYQVQHQGRQITFIDTPGHAAFNKMRERGAHLTDIVVLVVAADDGVKPQTIESIRHIKSGTAAVIVAINKMDKDNAFPDMVKAQLVEHEILVQGYGGDIEVVEISAKTGQGVDKLLEAISLTAELLELQADPAAPLEAVVIESTLDARRGAVASVIVQQGTLKVRQDLVSIDDQTKGRVKQLFDENAQPLTDAMPGCPAEILGLSSVPPVGMILHDASVAYQVSSDSDTPDDSTSTVSTPSAAGIDLDALFNETPRLKLIVKSDVEGTLEAIRQQLDPETVELLSAGVGELTEQDIELAATTNATVIVFHTRVPRRLKDLAKTRKIKLKEYDVIYKLLEDLQKQMLKLMDSSIDEVVLGEAEVLQIFEMRGEKIAGCRMKSGEIKRGTKLHLKRGEEVVADPEIKSLMHGKQEIESAKHDSANQEFGCTFKSKKLQFQPGDVLVAYRLEDE